MSKIESSVVPLHFSQTFSNFILINKKVLAILIFHVLAMPAVSRHVFFHQNTAAVHQNSCRIFCLQWRGSCQKYFKVKGKMASTFSFVNRQSVRNTILDENGGFHDPHFFGGFGGLPWPLSSTLGQKIDFQPQRPQKRPRFFLEGKFEVSKNGTFEAAMTSMLFYFFRPMKMWKKRY